MKLMRKAMVSNICLNCRQRIKPDEAHYTNEAYHCDIPTTQAYDKNEDFNFAPRAG